VTEIERFEQQKRENIQALGRDTALQERARDFIRESGKHRYTYHFTWLGRPVIQFPQDLAAIQEVLWQVKPAAVVETGVAHGGSLVFHASMLELIGGAGEVIGIDIDIRAHNRVEIEKHPLARRIHLIQGSSIDPRVVQKVGERVGGRGPVVVILDSNHTHEHVAKELELYSPLVRAGSYLIVLDTSIEWLPEEHVTDRPWGKGNNPMTAVHEFLKKTDRFAIDAGMHHKLLITVAPDGYLKCVKD
jgi:cephalosporin hydroxylase